MEIKPAKQLLSPLGSLLLFFTGYFVIWYLANSFLVRVVQGYGASLIMTATVVLFTLLLCRLGRIPLREFGLRKERIGLQLIYGSCLAAGLLVIFIGGATLIGAAPHEYLGAATPNEPMLFINLLYYIFIIGTTEEFIFRGYMLRILSDLTKSPVWGVILSSLIFGSAHYLGSGSLLQVFFTFLIGLALAFPKQYLKHCTLLSVIIAHGLYNVALEFIRWFYC